MNCKPNNTSSFCQSMGNGQSDVTVPHFLKLKSALYHMRSNFCKLVPGGESTYITNSSDQTKTVTKPEFIRLDSTGNSIPDSEIKSVFPKGNNTFSQSTSYIGSSMTHNNRNFSNAQSWPWATNPVPQEPNLMQGCFSAIGYGQGSQPWVPCQDPRRKPFLLPGGVGYQPFYNRDVRNWNYFTGGQSGPYSQGYFVEPPMPQHPNINGQSTFQGFGYKQTYHHNPVPDLRRKATNKHSRKERLKKQPSDMSSQLSKGRHADVPVQTTPIEADTIDRLSQSVGEIDITSEKAKSSVDSYTGIEPKSKENVALDSKLDKGGPVRTTDVNSPNKSNEQDVKTVNLPNCPTKQGLNCVKCLVVSDPHSENTKNLTMLVDNIENSEVPKSDSSNKSLHAQPGFHFIIHEVPLDSVQDSASTQKQFSVTCTGHSKPQAHNMSTNTPQKKKKCRPSQKKRQRLKERKGLLENAHVASFLSQNNAKRVKTSHCGDSGTLSAEQKKTSSPKPLAIMVGLRMEEGYSAKICDTIHAQVSFTMDSSDDSDFDETDYVSEGSCDLWQSFSSPMMFNVTCVTSQSQCLPERETEVSPEVQAANRRWEAAVKAVQSPRQTDKKISFAPAESLTCIHQVDVWDRKGPWEEYARDRERFHRRIEEINDAIGYIFATDHRNKILQMQANCVLSQ